MRFVQGPDFPTAGLHLGAGTASGRAYETGRGTISCGPAEIEVEEEERPGVDRHHQIPTR